MFEEMKMLTTLICLLHFVWNYCTVPHKHVQILCVKNKQTTRHGGTHP
jgi:hypothetical protein